MKFRTLGYLISLGLNLAFIFQTRVDLKSETLRRIRVSPGLEDAFRILSSPSEGLKGWLEFVLEEFEKEIEQLEIIGEKRARTETGENLRFFYTQDQKEKWQNPQILPRIVFLYSEDQERIGIFEGNIFAEETSGMKLLENLPSGLIQKVKGKVDRFKGPVLEEEKPFKLFVPWVNDSSTRASWEAEIRGKALLERLFLNTRFYQGNPEIKFTPVNRLSLGAPIFALVRGGARAIYDPNLSLLNRRNDIPASWIGLFMQEFAHHFYNANPQFLKEIKLAEKIKTLHPEILKRLGSFFLYEELSERELINEAYAHLWQVFISSYQAEPLTVDNPEKEKSQDFSYYQRIFPDETDGLRVGDAQLFADIGFLPEEAGPAKFNPSLKEESLFLPKEYFLWLKERF
jgi:hypothetical protein